MSDAIRIQLMGNYLFYINETRIENPIARSRKGAAFIELLILNRGQAVASQRLIRSLWPGNRATNPENALKTLVSRVRAMLNQISPEFSGCIASERGAYRWVTPSNVRVDALEIMDIFDRLAAPRQDEDLRPLYQRLMTLFAGDLYQPGEFEEEAAYAEGLHSRYLSAVYDYVELLNQTEEYNEISAVCRTALEIDSFDDRLNIELMKAMVNVDRVSDALTQYQHATSSAYRYLGMPPSEEMKEFYRQLSRSRRTLRFNLDAIRNALQEGMSASGAFVCEFEMFKEIYSLQFRNMERLGTTMFLGIIMVGSPDEPIDSMKQDTIIAHLIEILRNNLRKGDLITRFSPSVLALLLPTVNYETGNMVMERMRQLFYKRYPSSDIPFHYRLGILGRQAGTQGESFIEDGESVTGDLFEENERPKGK